MKPAILVVSHPNTPEKERILKDFGNFISQYGIDHYLVTNYPANKETQSEFKGSYFTSYNPPGLFNGVVWREFSPYNIRHNVIIPNWCYSATHLQLEGIKLLKHLGYTHVIALMYDLEPSFDKIKSWIDLCLDHLQSKKGIFVTDPAPDWGDVITTTQYACEVDLFINVFEKTLSDYFNTSSSLCEIFWYKALTPYFEDIIVLPKEYWIKSTYDSGATPQTPQGEKYYVGSYYENIGLIIETNNLNLVITNSQSEIIPHIIIDNSPNQIYLEFTPVNLESYYVNGHYLFTNNDAWRSRNYFEKINK